VPELPEVEFARGVLEKTLLGARIVRASGEDALVIHGDLERLVGARVTGVERRGKRLRVAFEAGDLIVFSHLGMSGEWIRSSIRRSAPARAVRSGSRGLQSVARARA
jgi:formamidopyrimidine-DNA glycosylase